MKGARTTRAGQAERYARYSKLRNSGVCSVEAASDIGISDRSRILYETSYRRDRGLPSYGDEIRLARLRRY